METNQYKRRWQGYHLATEQRKDFPKPLQKAWEKSDQLGIDFKTVRPYPLDQLEVFAVNNKNRILLTYASSFLEPMLKYNFKHSDLAILLFDHDANLLQVYAHKKTRTQLAEQGICNLTNCSEKHLGVNCISYGLSLAQKSEFRGEDNYAQCFIGYHSYFIPIYLGTLKLSGGLVLMVEETKNGPYLDQLLQMVYQAVTLQFFWLHQMQQYITLTKTAGYFALDQSGGKNNILLFSEELKSFLNIKENELQYKVLEEIIDPLPQNRDFWDMINHRKRVVDQLFQLSIKHHSTQLNLSSTPYYESTTHLKGMMISIDTMKHIKQIVSKFSANSVRFSFDTMIGESFNMRDAIQHGQIAAKGNSNILLTGESGCGKDVFAQAIHFESSRKQAPFIAINCAAFSKELIASELFGYEGGAFTGARREGSIGKFELADQGTLFLDEIGDMPLDLQAMLLRVIEDKSFTKVGGNKRIDVNVRIITATNQNLFTLIQNGQFREDLFYRLGVVRINIPPLRERRNDIIAFSDYFLKTIGERIRKPNMFLSTETKAFFLSYAWPGNVRELQNLLEGLMSMQDDKEIRVASVQDYLGIEQNFYNGEAHKPAISTAYDMDMLDKAFILRILKECRQNKTKAAKILGISRSTLYRRLKED